MFRRKLSDTAEQIATLIGKSTQHATYSVTLTHSLTIIIDKVHETPRIKLSHNSKTLGTDFLHRHEHHKLAKLVQDRIDYLDKLDEQDLIVDQLSYIKELLR